MDKYGIDRHKLHYHVERVAAWKKGEHVYPLYMEISPSGACNHRCIFCGLDFMEYQNRFLETELLEERLTEMGRLGLKSVMYAGEGEPFLHKEMVEIINHTKKVGIDVALTTNGVLLSPKIAEQILGSVEWIKVSCNAGTADTYAKIHGTKPAHFTRVVSNLEQARRIIRENGYTCVLGMQILLLPENRVEVGTLAGIARDIGLKYLVVKPYSQHPQSETAMYADIEYRDAENLAAELESYNTDAFQVIVRLRTMRKWNDKARKYKRCMALPFWSYLDAGGNVWGCSVFLGDERFRYGNIYEQNFEEIWNGMERLDKMAAFNADFDPSRCRVNCRMDEINNYLWELNNPPEHVNFI